MEQVSRRGLLGLGTASAAAVLLGTGALDVDVARAQTKVPAYPFTLGVASGDPHPDGVVLWTRLAPEPLHPEGTGGMGARPVPVHWEVARDEAFTDLVKRGRVTAVPELAHSVHVEVGGLQPSREYFYRFRALGEISDVGRTKTAPPVDAAVSSLTFAFASCQAWDDGFYTAYRHLADEQLDFVVHLGDYLYEYAIKGTVRGVTPPEGFDTETDTLQRYRMQYGLYKSDANLKAAHAAAPWIVTLDDHEVDNNWAAAISQDEEVDTETFLARRAAAFQAFYENLPLRRDSTPAGPHMRLHRRLTFGTMLDLTMIDTRQYRDDQPCGDGKSVDCPERFESGRTMLGEEQRAWLLAAFQTSGARWHALGNQVPMCQTDTDAGEPIDIFLDPWDGYVAERDQLLRTAGDSGVRNLVVMTGDRHQNYASDLLADFTDPDSPVVAAEFVGTSITSSGDGEDLNEAGRTFLEANPHLRFCNTQRGYVRCRLTPERWNSDFRVVERVTSPDSPISTRATMVVEDGRPGVVSDAV